MSVTKTKTGKTNLDGVNYQVTYTALALPSENSTRISLTLSYYTDTGTRTGTLAYRAVLGDVSQSSERSFSMGTLPTAFCEMPAVLLAHDAFGEIEATLYVRATLNGTPVHFVCPLEIAPISRISRIGTLPTGTLGEVYSVRFLPTSSDFSHTFTLRVGAWSYTADCAKDPITGEEILSLTLPFAIANEEKNAASVTATLTLRTYLDAYLLGEDVCSFALIFPDCTDLRPSFTATVSPVGTLPEAFAGCFLQQRTPLLLTLDVTTYYGATKARAEVRYEGEWYEITGDSITLDAPTGTGLRPLHVRVSDSRGFVAERLLSIDVKETRAPRVVPITGAERVLAYRSSEGVADENGTSLYLAFDGACTQGSSYTLQYRMKSATDSAFGDWITLAENAAFCATVTGVVLSLTQNYALELCVLDVFGERGVLSFTLPGATVCFHLKRGGDGAAFGKYAEETKTLEIAPDWTLRVHGTLDACSTLHTSTGLVAERLGGTRVRVRFSRAASFDGTRTLLAKDFLPTDACPSQTVYALGVCEGGGIAVLELTPTGALSLTHVLGASIPATFGFVSAEIGYDVA